MTTIRFDRSTQTSTFHNPMLGNQLDTQTIELRRDPLTGVQSLFNARLEDKVAMFLGATEPALIERLARESEARCFLCADKWKQMTPTYPEAVVPEGRVQQGEVVLFPNIFPVSQVHAVIRVGKRHSLPLDQFESSLIRDAISVSLAFTRSIVRAEPSVRFLTIAANYLGPAGASIAHPHFQVVGGDTPCTWAEQTGAAAERWSKKHGTCYFEDLLRAEQEIGERTVGRTGRVAWIASYCPQGANELWGVVEGKRDFLELDDDDAAAMGDGIARVLRGYASMGLSTFNLGVFCGPLGGRDDAWRCVVRIISRQNVYENYRADDYFLQKLMSNELILVTPEALATRMRTFFPA
jgi:UDPglucose--hexose-1-phosphate uridylyltransferase